MAKKKRASASSPHSAAPASAASALTRLDPAPDRPGKEQDPRQARNNAPTAATAQSDRPQSLRWPGGSWRGKASAVAGLTQSISAAASTAADSVQSRIPATPPSRLSRSLRTPSKSSACAASTTRLSVIANSQDDSTDMEQAKEPITDKDSLTVDVGASKGSDENGTADDRIFNERPLPPPGWRGWWTKADDSSAEKDATQLEREGPDSERNNATGQGDSLTPADTIKTSMDRNFQATPVSDEHSNPRPLSNGDMTSDAPNEEGQHATSLPQQRSSWFALWANSSGSASDMANGVGDQKAAPSEPTHSTPDAQATGTVTQTDPSKASDGKETSAKPQTSGSWAFWSREQPKTEYVHDLSTGQTAESGQLTIAGEPSEVASNAIRTGKPAALTDTVDDKVKKRTSAPSKKSAEDTRDKVTPFEKAVAAEQGGTVTPSSSGPLSSKTDISNNTSGRSTPSGVQTPSKESKVLPKSAEQAQLTTESIAQEESDKATGKKTQAQPNLVLPSFHDTFQVAESVAYWQQILTRVGRSAVPESRHLSKSPSPPRLHNALAIGVHGYFPAPLIQKVLGPPTGTSTRFANRAAAAIRQWTAQQGYNCEVGQVALDGEGVIAERVDTLWKLLLKWVEQIRKADFIMMACHSQGVPVSAMLMAKLIELGCIKPSARLSICAMAGTNLGPFPNYTSRFLGLAANELFAFSSPTSLVSRTYISSLSLCLRHHVRIAYIGSIDDQLVSLESSLFSTVDHPYIYRAVFVDGRIHAPDFLTHLVGFALKLRNLGVSDHGLIRELSAPLAGSLYSGEGHSRIYEEQGVYELAVVFALESTALSAAEMSEVNVKAEYEVPNAANSNPYFLPWAMRGVLEEDFVRKECKEETEDLIRLFEEWKPLTKVLKDVKFRLEAIRTRT